MRHLYILLLIIFNLFSLRIYCQRSFCADSSIRIKYIFSTKGAELYNNADTSGINYFAGAYGGALNFVPKGIAIMKSNWGDSIFWAKRFYSTSAAIDFNNTLAAPAGTRICTGNYLVSSTNANFILVSRIDTNGNILWAKTYRSNQGASGSLQMTRKNILVTSNAIYLYCGSSETNNSIIFKLDLDGNIIWSTALQANMPSYTQYVEEAPVLINNILFIASHYSITLPNGTVDEFPIITKLNGIDGSYIESTDFRVVPDAIVKQIIPTVLHGNNNNSLLLSGFTLNNSPGPFTVIFNAILDTSLNSLKISAYKYFLPASPHDFQHDFNTLYHHAILGYEVFNPNNKYFVTFDAVNQVLRNRKFVVAGNFFSQYTNSVNLDEKQNLHFLYHFPLTTFGSTIVTEYARISNFAPSGTTSCFGKDTSLFTPASFNINKEHFTWDNIKSNILSSNAITLSEDTAVVTKQVICKIVSYCDSIHIKGQASVCVNQPARYSIFKNNTCYKNLDWQVDTSAANIISTEGDSAITIRFKKAFSGYIHAAITDCVVKDSFFVQAVTPVPRPLINHTDSLLCPGKTLWLNANTGFTNYLWQGATSGMQLAVSSAGLYKITALDSCGNNKTDSITVAQSDTSLIILPPAQTICLFDTAFILLPADVNSITWQPATNSLLRNNTLVAYPGQNTIYSITAQRAFNCPLTKTAVVTIQVCPQTVFVPNAFTPNKNGVNDLFKPIISQPLATYRLLIYNRYGQPVFETTNQRSGWDGTYKGSRQPMGGYIYNCYYQFAGKPQKTVSGYFMLIR